MKHLHKRLVSFFLALVLVIGMVSAGIAPKAEAAELNSGIYLRQETNYTCTLASCTMIIRARMYLSNNSNWSNVTESSVRRYGWIEGAGVRASNWTYY